MQAPTKWRGATWTAMLTDEEYGPHFSVGAEGRKPTDDEVSRAFVAHEKGEWAGGHRMTEVTSWWSRHGQVNPYVRHFVPERQANRVVPGR